MRNCPHNGTRAWGPGSANAPIGRWTGPRTDGQVEGGLDIRKHSRPWLTGREGPLSAAVAVPGQALAEWHACLLRAWATEHNFASTTWGGARCTIWDQAGTWQRTRALRWRLHAAADRAETIDAHGKREHWPRERVGLAWLDALMAQLHGAHDNGRPANTPAQTRNLAEHQADRSTPGRIRLPPSKTRAEGAEAPS